jgi:hypothetical protein
MVNLENVKKAINDSSLQVLRQIEMFDNYYESIWHVKTYTQENIAQLDSLMQGLNVDGYTIYQNTDNAIDDARTLYFGSLKIMRSTA